MSTRIWKGVFDQADSYIGTVMARSSTVLRVDYRNSEVSHGGTPDPVSDHPARL